MRLLLACGVFFMAAGAAPAQTLGPASLQSLNFLLGTWAAEGAGPLPQITEFRWIRRQENPMVVGGRWTCDVYNCPWCVTRGIMVAYYDTASSEVRVRFAEKTPWAAGFRMVSAHPGSAQFMSVAEPGRHTYRLTCKLTIEERSLDHARRSGARSRKCLLYGRSLELSPPFSGNAQPERRRVFDVQMRGARFPVNSRPIS